jgi:hypothetical protein
MEKLSARLIVEQISHIIENKSKLGTLNTINNDMLNNSGLE